MTTVTTLLKVDTCIDLNGKTAQKQDPGINTTTYHYVIVRKDLTAGQQAAQIVHAAGESAIPKPEPGTRAVALHAESEDHLLEISSKLDAAGVKHECVIEDDGQLMALGLHPTIGKVKLLSSLPLVK